MFSILCWRWWSCTQGSSHWNRWSRWWWSRRKLVDLGGTPGTAGTVNTGGGGGGGAGSVPGAGGGSGIVIVRAPGSAGLAASPGTNTVATLPAPAGGCKVATFTVSGDLTIS
jgi:hypothetical protein